MDRLGARMVGLTGRLIATVAALLLFAGPAQSADRFWVGLDGSWNDGANWALVPGGAAGAGPPLAGDNVFLTQSDAYGRTVNYINPAGATSRLARLLIDSTGSGTITLFQGQDELFVDALAVVGGAGSGIFELRGAVATLPNLILGSDPGSNGMFRSQHAVLLSVTTVVGFSGQATFNHHGGGVELVRQLVLGFAPAGVGRFEMEEGSLTTNELFVGNLGRGEFVHSGGSVSVRARIEIASEAGSVGEYTMDHLGGSDSPTLNFGDTLVNKGTFTQRFGSLSGFTFDNSGIFAIGRSRGFSSVETLIHRPTGQLRFEVGDVLLPGESLLMVSTTARLDGQVRIELAAGSSPRVGDSYAILSAAAGITGYRPGQFSLPRLPGPIALRSKLSADAKTLAVEVISVDLDGNGGVDCADWAVVRLALGKRPGQPGYDPRADLNGDAMIDVRDLAIVAQKLTAGTVCR